MSHIHGVDRAVGAKIGCTIREDVGPVRAETRPLFDPSFQNEAFRFVELVMSRFGRHRIIGINDSLPKFARRGVSRNDRKDPRGKLAGRGFKIEQAQVRFSGLCIRPVARKAMLRKNGADFSREVERRRLCGGISREPREKNREKTEWDAYHQWHRITTLQRGQRILASDPIAAAGRVDAIRGKIPNRRAAGQGRHH